ncbi:MAG: hypothetical protein IH793_04935, partial [Acidobacteria bacterium]|nr:hypothetical protein [Acidobacteriota bacterium]
MFLRRVGLSVSLLLEFFRYFFKLLLSSSGGAAADFTALGDNVNVAARLASSAAQGEVIISEATYGAAEIANDELERRELQLKGK